MLTNLKFHFFSLPFKQLGQYFETGEIKDVDLMEIHTKVNEKEAKIPKTEDLASMDSLFS